MFRSNLEAALQRTEALQRALDTSRSENELLRRQLANATARLQTVDSANALQRRVDQLSEQLASTQGLLSASENERRRLASLVPSTDPSIAPSIAAPRRDYANPTNPPPPTRYLAPVWLLGVGLALMTYFILAAYTL